MHNCLPELHDVSEAVGDHLGKGCLGIIILEDASCQPGLCDKASDDHPQRQDPSLHPAISALPSQRQLKHAGSRTPYC